MEIYLLIGVLVFVTCIIIFSFYNRKNNKKEKVIKKEISLSVDNNISNFPDIQIIENATVIPSEKNKIVDSNVKNAISILDNSVSKSAMVGKNLGTASKALNSDRAFFSAAKSGTENMMKMKGSNEFIGTQMVDGKFSKQTRFLSEDKMMANMGKDALVNAGFNAASMVVGQYYMNEINDKLENIQHDIDGIANFLDDQYKGKLMSIVDKIQEILDYKIEIISNEFSRNKRYNEISRLEEKNRELLNQANASILNYLKDNLDYKNYEKNVKDIQKWSVRQQILMRLLAEIGELRYVLANGNESAQQAHAPYNRKIEQTNKVNEQLNKWHEFYCQKFGVDKSDHKRKANFFEIRKNTIGRINEEWAYSKLNESTETMIDSQTNIMQYLPFNNEKLNENIKILKHNGEYYNLPETTEQ